MNRPLAHLAVALLACCAARAQLSPCVVVGTNNGFLGVETLRLWPGAAPQAKGNTCNDIPTLTVFEPQPGTGNGSAVVVFAGGGYSGLAGNLEGRQVADWFTARGFVAFILSYRLSSNGYLLPVPLLDARRAIQTVRARAADYHFAPNRIVVIGFSAGGHLAALAATQPVAGNPDADDPIDRVSSRPDFLILGYPWIDAITTDTSHLSYCQSFHVMDQCDALRAKYDPVLFVNKDTPPTFLYHTFPDETVPVQQALRFYNALVSAGVDSELHIFDHGAHGSGLGKGDPALDQWPNLLEIWLRGHGLLTADKAAPQN
jgi:acetyl esterase/lipase